MRPSNPRLLLALVTKKKPWTKIGNTYSHSPLFGLAVVGGATSRPVVASAICYGALHVTIVSGRIRLAMVGGSKIAR